MVVSVPRLARLPRLYRVFFAMGLTDGLSSLIRKLMQH